MRNAIRPAARALIASTALSGLLLTSTAFMTGAYAQAPAQTTQPAQSETFPPDSQATPKSTHHKGHKPTAAKAEEREDRLEAHIARLHTRLMITADQEPAWTAFAQVMRDNGHAMEDTLKNRDSAKTMNAVDDMQSYATIAQAHADGVQKLVPAFKTLYDGLTPEQKANADKVFDQSRHGMMGGEHKKHAKL